MSLSGPERRLAAILSTDAVGYSRLMTEDEAGTAETLKTYRGLISGVVRTHGGRVVDAVGDNLLAEFRSVVDAVASGLDIQRELATQNRNRLSGHELLFRIGIHLGDLIVDGERIVGSDVNIAARIEALAEPGGLAVSAAAYDHVEGRVDVRFHDLGNHTLKNIPRPVHVYRVDSESLGEASTDQGEPWKSALTVPGFGGRPAITVLPFENRSDDRNQGYFAEGVAEDLAARLAGWRWFPVVARDSTTSSPGSAINMGQLSRDLGVRYIVEGSVRRGEGTLRVTVRLTDAPTRRQVWAEHYDREPVDLFVLQDEIVDRILTALEPRVRDYEANRAIRRQPENLDAWDLAQQGLWHMNQLTAEALDRALGLFVHAGQLDSGLAIAQYGIALTHLMSATLFDWTDSQDQRISAGMAAAKKCVGIDNLDPYGKLALGAAYHRTGQINLAIDTLEFGLELNPCLAQLYSWLSMVLVADGRPYEAIASSQKALRLSPRDPWLFQHHCTMAIAYFAAGRDEDALRAAQRSCQLRPRYIIPLSLAVAALANLRRTDEARGLFEEVLGLVSPDWWSLPRLKSELSKIQGNDYAERVVTAMEKVLPR